VGAIQAAQTRAAGVHRLKVEYQQAVLEGFAAVRHLEPGGPVAVAIAEALAHLKALAANPRDLAHDLRHQRKS
jgi:hypothetical protein